MKYAVLVKQVPDISQMEFDRETRRLRREGVRLEVSSFDVRALLRALELRQQTGGEVVVATMGPPSARDALVHCLALGADRGIHLVDLALAGSDTLATARALALLLRRERFDIALCGKASVDAETGQVGPEIAELLDLPQVTAARTLEIDVRLRRLRAERETDDGFETLECPLPAVVSAAEDLAVERFPKRAEKEAAKEKPIETLEAQDLSEDLSVFGIPGSPTWVESIEILESKREGRVLEGDPESAARALVGILAERGLFAPRATAAAAAAPAPRGAPGDPARAVWVVAELAGGAVRRATWELLGKAAEIAARTGGEVGAVLLGHGVRDHVTPLAERGADRVVLIDDPLLGEYTTDGFAGALALAIETRRPRSVLLTASALGRDLAPRVAGRLGLGLTGDAIDLTIDGEGRLVQWKPAFGGNVVAAILSRTSPEMATVRAGMFDVARSVPGRVATIDELRLEHPLPIRTLVVDRRRAAGIERAALLDEAEVAIGVGKGIGGPDGLPAIDDLADALGGAGIAATRDVTDAGWLPRHHQVGITGRAISPRLYFAVGVRGAFEHTASCRRAGTIVAINKNPKAAIFAQADLGIVGDWAAVVPALAREIRARRAG